MRNYFFLPLMWLVDLMRNCFSVMRVTGGSHKKLFQYHEGHPWITWETISVRRGSPVDLMRNSVPLVWLVDLMTNYSISVLWRSPVYLMRNILVLYVVTVGAFKFPVTRSSLWYPYVSRSAIQIYIPLCTTEASCDPNRKLCGAILFQIMADVTLFSC